MPAAVFPATLGSAACVKGSLAETLAQQSSLVVGARGDDGRVSWWLLLLLLLLLVIVPGSRLRVFAAAVEMCLRLVLAVGLLHNDCSDGLVLAVICRWLWIRLLLLLLWRWPWRRLLEAVVGIHGRVWLRQGRRLRRVSRGRKRRSGGSLGGEDAAKEEEEQNDG